MSRNPKKETVRLPADVSETLFGIMELAAAAVKPILELRRVIAETMAEWEGGLQRAMEQMAPMLQAIAESIRTFPERNRSELKILGEHGWYLDLEMSISGIRDIVHALEQGNIDEAEEALVQYYRERVKQIENELIEKFPLRSPILKQAFHAHKRMQYFISVPVFLSQADGICKELIGIQLFRKKDGIPATATYVNSIEDKIRASLLYPLSIPLLISASEKEREGYEMSLNRHEVLHGVSLDYGTEINSLKSISLLNYIANILTWSKEE